jgi:hypothetical protein
MCTSVIWLEYFYCDVAIYWNLKPSRMIKIRQVSGVYAASLFGLQDGGTGSFKAL